MVYRWQCRRCSFTIWSSNRTETVDAVEGHMLDHHRDRLANRDFQLSWECPYCDQSGQSHDEQEGIQRFKRHLFGHVEPLLEPNAHVAGEVDGTGNVLVRAPLESAGADNARIHFLSPGDIVLIVTTNPKDRLRLIQEQLGEWPAWTIVMTTKENPLAGIDDVDFATVPLEVVRLDRRLGLSDLGETISRVLEEQESTNGKISVEFDILSEIIEKFDAQTIFKFLHVLTRRLEDVDALSHFYVNPRAQSASTVNVLQQLFDISITADGQVFTARDRPEDT